MQYVVAIQTYCGKQGVEVQATRVQTCKQRTAMPKLAHPRFMTCVPLDCHIRGGVVAPAGTNLAAFDQNSKDRVA